MGENSKRARAGIRWDKVVERIWKELGGDLEEVLSREKFGGYSERKKRRKGNVSAKKQGEKGETLVRYTGR